MEELWKDMSLCSTPVAPPPDTALTHEFTCLGGAGAGKSNSATTSDDDPAGFHLGFSASGGGSKRAVVQPAVGGDRRQRRKIKNRESASRSRARRHAYTNEMEQELVQLRRENRMLIQREQDFINDRLAKTAQAHVPDCSSRSTSTLQQKQQQQQERCRSAPAP